MRRTTLRDISHASGYSITTVGNVLNQKAGFQCADETRNRILALADSLNYRPRRTGRLNKGRRLGFLTELSVFQDAFPGDSRLTLLGGAYQTVALRGWELVLVPGGHQALVENERIDALVVPLSSLLSPELLDMLEQRQIPYQAIDDPWDVTQSLIDEAPGINAAVALLANLGHRDIAILGNLSRFPNRHRLFAEAFATVGLEYQPEHHYDWPMAKNADGRLRFATDAGQAFTAAICLGDQLAMKAGQVLEAAGKSVPNDMSLIGFDDTPLAKWLGHTAVRKPLSAAAGAAADYLIHNLEHPDAPVPKPQFETDLVVRDSTGPRH